MPLTEIKLAGRQSRADEIYDALRAIILAGQLEPRERLVESKIARLASISRTPVREAIRKLEVDGLVWNTGQGMVVGSLSAIELADACAVREVLEGMAAGIAARARSELQVLSLQRLAQQYAITAGTDDVDDLVTLNHAFHEAVWQMAGNRFLEQQLLNMRANIERIQKTTLHHPERRKQSQEEHHLLTDAIAHQESDAATEIARRHYREAMAIRLSAVGVPG